MKYKGYEIKQTKSGKTFYAILNKKIQTWSNANSLEWCKKHIDNRIYMDTKAAAVNNEMTYGFMKF